MMQIAALDTWLPSGPGPAIISGPCSAETPEQLRATIEALAPLQLPLYRAGIWKPRTRPNTFEGNGEEALKWIAELKKEKGYRFAVEVASPAHVALALKYDIDVLWIGARSTVNPFTVQEIADSLRGTDIPVMIKNPVNPDLALWMGAIERISQAGITKLAAIHRGFSSFEKSRYRNQPMWQIPIELKTELPELPLFCDPSHIGGDRDMIFPISQESLDLLYDGLMIESHIDPDNAWSDAKQQVTPASLGQIISQLQTRQLNSNNPRFYQSMEEIRHRIDQADREILEAMTKRMRLVQEVGVYKKENNVSILQLARWKEIFKSRSEWAEKLQLDPDFARDLYRIIHLASIREQTAVMEEKKDEHAT